MRKNQPEKGLVKKSPSKSQSQNQHQEFAGKRTLNRETRDGACGELGEQYAETLPELSNQIKKIGNLTKEIISSLKKLNLQEEVEESSVDNTVIALTGGIEVLQNFQTSLKDLTIKLERSNGKIKQELQKEAVFRGIEKDLQHIKESKHKSKTQTKFELYTPSSYQDVNKKLTDKASKPSKQVNQKTSSKVLEEELEKNVRRTIPEDLRGDFDSLLTLWKQRSNSSKPQNNEEKILEENPKKSNVP